MKRLITSQKLLHASFLKPMKPHLMIATVTLQLNNIYADGGKFCCFGWFDLVNGNLLWKNFRGLSSLMGNFFYFYDKKD